jgi:hypothetical protein
MRKTWLLAATAAAAAMVLPAASASAMVRPAASTAATPGVLTINAVGGTNAGAKQLFQAGLQKGTSLTFSFSLSGLTVTIACTKSYATIRGATNPALPGTATGSLNKLNASNCTATASQSGLVDGVQSVTFTTPNATTISDATGDPVTVTGPLVTFTMNTVIGAVTCGYSATSISGAFSDTGSLMTFANQALDTLQAGSNSFCPTTTGVNLSATYGPLKDLSVTGRPAVFVN